MRVLYNSDLSFSDRLYGPLDVDLCRVKLHEPLSQIIQQPLLYVRDMVPKPCFQGLLNLHQVKVIYKLGQGHWKIGYDKKTEAILKKNYFFNLHANEQSEDAKNV